MSRYLQASTPLAMRSADSIAASEGRTPTASERSATSGLSDISRQKVRAERLGHRLDRLATPTPPEVSLAEPRNVPIQRVLYKDKGKQKKNAYKSIAQTHWYKKLNDRQRAWAHHLHGLNGPDDHYNPEEFEAKLAERDKSADEPPALPEPKRAAKRKREEPLVPRQTGPAVGNQVAYDDAPEFRTERRTLRKLKKVGKSPGDKNLYLKRYKPPGDKPFKLLTSSIPPSSLPKDYATRPLAELVDDRLGQTFHSEAVTKKIEDHYPPFKKQKIAEHESYSASSREQCESCRYDYPPNKPHAHKFGTFYSGTTDHIEGKELRDKLVKNKGIIGDLKLSEEEKKIVAEGRTDAAAARQFSPNQNPSLNLKRANLKEVDSEGEQSSDDDDLFLTHDLDWGTPGKPAQGYGKGKVHILPRRSYFSPSEIENETRKTQELRDRKVAAAASGAKDEEELPDAGGEDEDLATPIEED